MGLEPLWCSTCSAGPVITGRTLLLAFHGQAASEVAGVRRLTTHP